MIRMIDFLSSQSASFSVVNEDKVREGSVDLSSDRWGDIGAGIGHGIELGDSLRFRHEYGVRLVEIGMDSATYTRFDFAHMDLETVNEVSTLVGDVRAWGSRAAAYLDVALGEDSDNYLYIGTSVGRLVANMQYDLTIGDFGTGMDDIDVVWTKSLEVGAIIGVAENTDIFRLPTTGPCLRTVIL